MTRPLPTLARASVDRAAERRSDTDWLADQWRTRGLVLAVGPEGTASIGPGPMLRCEPTYGESPPPDAMLLGTDDEATWFCVLAAEPPAGGRSLREIGATLDDRDAGLLVTAVALSGWHRTHTHCPRCGTATVVTMAGWTRTCPADGSEHFPRTDPAVIVLVRSPTGDRALLGRQRSWPPQRYSCLAGFVEPGESAEQAVTREVAEEAGIRCQDVRAVVSQPWPVPASLMLAFTAVADPDQAVAGTDDELEDVRWFSRPQVAAGEVLLPPAVSVAHLLIDSWLRADDVTVTGRD